MSNPVELARVAFTQKIEQLKATFTDYPLTVEYGNGDAVNVALQTRPYLKASIRYQDGKQIDLAERPGHRLIGTIVLEARVKAGAGTKQANDLLWHFYPALHMSEAMYPLRTLAARLTPAPVKDGWTAESALIPFWIDSVG